MLVANTGQPDACVPSDEDMGTVAGADCVSEDITYTCVCLHLQRLSICAEQRLFKCKVHTIGLHMVQLPDKQTCRHAKV